MECPFTEQNPAANEKFAKDMEEVCALITPNGNSVTSLHANLQRGMCNEDGDDSMKIIADIQYGLCWRVIDNQVNGRDFGCPFFVASQKYIAGAVAALKKIEENNKKAWKANYCDFVLWRYNEYGTLSVEAAKNRVRVSRVGVVPYESNIRKGDKITGIVEPGTGRTGPFGLLPPRFP